MAKNEALKGVTSGNVYEEQFDKARTDGNTKPLNVDQIKWEKPGERVIGRLVSIQKLTSQKKDDEFYYQYVIDQGARRVSTICGFQVDQILGDGAFLEKVVCITYKGKLELPGGKRLNEFTVEVLLEG